jgi:hypothetical protein
MPTGDSVPVERMVDPSASSGQPTAFSLQLTAPVGCDARSTSEPPAVSRGPIAEHDLP